MASDNSLRCASVVSYLNICTVRVCDSLSCQLAGAARVDPKIPDGMVFVPFAYAEAAANLLTNPALDPYGKIPEFKYAACRLTQGGT